METKSLFEWQGVLFQYVGFLSSFAMLGAVGFQYGVLRAGDASPAGALEKARSNAAGIGLAGAGLGAVSLVEGLLKRAASKHQTIGEAFGAGGSAALLQVVLLAVLALAFALGWRRIAIGWPVAGVASIAYALRNLLGGRLGGMVNPLHVLGASLWLGTLFVLVVCGVGQMLRSSVPVADRERAVAEMVHRFSTVGLASAALLGVTGVITSWTHLNPLAALWTTPYGYALVSKLCVVAVVVGLGAWNWRRVGPALGSDGGALTIRRTARTGSAFAALVLLLTAILVSLPSPKAPGH